MFPQPPLPLFLQPDVSYTLALVLDFAALQICRAKHHAMFCSVHVTVTCASVWVLGGDCITILLLACCQKSATMRGWLQAVLDTLELGLKIKKTPVVVGNCTGFAVNRVFFPYTMSACLLADLGADPYMIDKVVKGMFGMPMGPFRLCDLVRSPHCACCVSYPRKCMCRNPTGGSRL